MNNYVVFLISVFCIFVFADSARAFQGEQTQNRALVVYLNDMPHTRTGNVRPCYPVMARFEHPDPAVTRVRMRYPYNHEMYMFFPMNESVHIWLHEDYMKQGQLSLSDFIAEDENGNEYGQITLTFIPLDPENQDACNEYLSS